MKKLITLGVATGASLIAFYYFSRERRGRLTSVIRTRMRQRLEHMMSELPEGSPPKLVMSILPILRAQNDQIIAMLREQNELLREQHSPAITTAA